MDMAGDGGFGMTCPLGTADRHICVPERRDRNKEMYLPFGKCTQDSLGIERKCLFFFLGEGGTFENRLDHDLDYFPFPRAVGARNLPRFAIEKCNGERKHKKCKAVTCLFLAYLPTYLITLP